MLRYVLLIALVAVVSADPVHFKNCGSSSDLVSVNSVDVTPWPPKAGKDVTISASGHLGAAVKSGTFQIKAEYFGLDVYDKSGDLCQFSSDFQCPHDAGDISLTKSINLPGGIPSGDYDITIKLKSDAGQLLCAQITASISSNAVPANDVPVVDAPVAPELDLSSPALHDDMIAYVNSVQKSWTAGKNAKFAKATLKDISDLCGVLPGGPTLPEVGIPENLKKYLNIPASFDAREAWPNCASLKQIRDQGACGSCWAVAAAAAMTDRLCIHSGGNDQTLLSSQDLTSCCGFQCGMGCNGGWPSGAWDYFVQTGLVSGGEWNSHVGCFPYQVESCDHHVNGTRKPCGDLVDTPRCAKKCEDGASWSQDKRKAKTSISVPSDEESIQAEILAHGPVEAAFTVYADFPTYRSGVYHHTSGSQLGGHAVKILGWGEENGTPYWLVANSWNEDWGDNGYFKIRRGNNECGIESQIVAGMPN